MGSMMKHVLLTLNMSEEHLLRLSFNRMQRQTVGMPVLQRASQGQVSSRRLPLASVGSRHGAEPGMSEPAGPGGRGSLNAFS